MYWWTETWQKGERLAEADRRAGWLQGTFATVQAWKEGIRKRPAGRAI